MDRSWDWHEMCQDFEGVYPLYAVTNILVPLPSTCNEAAK